MVVPWARNCAFTWSAVRSFEGMVCVPVLRVNKSEYKVKFKCKNFTLQGFILIKAYLV